jgi:quinol monooxygenase YgiN
MGNSSTKSSQHQLRRSRRGSSHARHQVWHTAKKLATVVIVAVTLLLFKMNNNITSILPSWASAEQLLLRKSSTSEPIFSLMVTLDFQSIDDVQQFQKDIEPVAVHVRNHEPDTLAYEVLLSDKDPLQVLIMERYRNKDVAYLQVHKSSAPFLAFRPKLQAMQESGRVLRMSGNSYLDSGVGFGDRVVV